MANIELLKKLKDDASFKEKMENAKSEQEVLEIFEEYGVEISSEEFAEIFAEKSGELTSEELDNVSGGAWKGLVYYFGKFMDWLMEKVTGGQY